MSPLPETRRTALQWVVGLLAWGFLIGCAYLLFGCTSPGAAGFHELARSNARERTVLRALKVHSDHVATHVNQIGQHTANAEKYAGMLAATALTRQQAEWLHDLRLELKATTEEKNALQLENANLLQDRKSLDDLVLQREATIRQTQAEVRAAISDHWWSGIWLRVEWLGIGVLAGSIIVWVLRATIHAAILAGAVYFPPLAVLARKPTS